MCDVASETNLLVDFEDIEEQLWEIFEQPMGFQVR